MNVRILVLLSLLVAAACAPDSGPIARVTPLPSASTPIANAPTLTPTILPSPTPASGFGALIAAASRQPETGKPTAEPSGTTLANASAMQIALATDTVLQLTPRAPMTFDAYPVPLTFDEFYDGYDLRTGLILSDKLVSLDGQRVMLEGYMAPPLKPELDYFVLTRIRLSFCPFCSTAADWPDDIALIYLGDSSTGATLDPVRVTGRLEVGMSVDQDTGMVSLVRLYAEQLEILR